MVCTEEALARGGRESRFTLEGEYRGELNCLDKGIFGVDQRPTTSRQTLSPLDSCRKGTWKCRLAGLALLPILE